MGMETTVRFSLFFLPFSLSLLRTPSWQQSKIALAFFLLLTELGIYFFPRRACNQAQNISVSAIDFFCTNETCLFPLNYFATAANMFRIHVDVRVTVLCFYSAWRLFLLDSQLSWLSSTCHNIASRRIYYEKCWSRLHTRVFIGYKFTLLDAWRT